MGEHQMPIKLRKANTPNEKKLTSPGEVPPAFRKNPTLRACKILCKKSGDIGNYGEAKRRTKIGMYKKMHRSIEQKRRFPYESRGSSLSLLPIIGRYVNLT